MASLPPRGNSPILREFTKHSSRSRGQFSAPPLRIYATLLNIVFSLMPNRALKQLLGRLTGKLLEVQRHSLKRSLIRNIPSLFLALLRLIQFTSRVPRPSTLGTAVVSKWCQDDRGISQPFRSSRRFSCKWLLFSSGRCWVRTSDLLLVREDKGVAGRCRRLQNPHT